MKSLAWALLLALSPAFAADGDVICQEIVVRQGDTLATIAQTYLKDPTRWDEILKHNKQLSHDPFVVLPGMMIRVPVRLIKEELRAARLVFKLREVFFRKKDVSAWAAAASNMELFRGDWLKTGIESKARVATPALLITPRTEDAKYVVQVNDENDTRVEVFRGRTTVEAQGKKVDLLPNQAIRVRRGEAPSSPVPADSLPDFQGRTTGFLDAMTSLRNSKVRVSPPPATALPAAKALDGLGALKKELEAVSVGVPVSGYRIQVSRDKGFGPLLVDRVFEVGSKIDLSASLSSGRYWVRFAVVDLLGAQEKFRAPKLCDWSPRSGFKPAEAPASADSP